MDIAQKFAIYFSHNWRDLNLPINLMLWRKLSVHGHLLVDRPEPIPRTTKPYFISRIEARMRRADLFVACIPGIDQLRGQKMRLPRRSSARSLRGDWLHPGCSPFILFELRIAERLNLPRLVLFDVESGFTPPLSQPPHVCYLPCQFGELRELVTEGVAVPDIDAAMERWFTWVHQNRRPAMNSPTGRSALLVADKQTKIAGAAGEALKLAGFEKPRPLTEMFGTDAEMADVLRSLGVLVVDVSRPENLALYHMAHALGVPSVRLHRDAPPPTDDDRFVKTLEPKLPMVLQGHPGGYVRDLLPLQNEEEIFSEIAWRGRGVLRSSTPVVTFDKGCFLIAERTFPHPHSVFISHDEKLVGRPLVDEIVTALEARGINCWEYVSRNPAGVNWEKELDSALAKMTHMIVLASPTYQTSKACMDELKFAVKHGIPIFPFLTNGNTKSLKEHLGGLKLAHEPLRYGKKEEVDAAHVAERMRHELLAYKPPSA